MSEKELPKTQEQKINPAVLKMFAEAMAAQNTKPNKQPLTKRQAIMEKFTKTFMEGIGKAIVFVDRLINLITKPHDEGRNEVVESARDPILFGTYIIIFFFVFGGLWSAFAPLDSAAHISGILVSSSNKKILNHPQGGILKAIYVKQGEHVKEGDPIVALDDVGFKSQYESYLHQYRSLLANEAMLIAERDNLDSITFPAFLLDNASDPEVKKTMDIQINLLQSRKDIFTGTISSLHHKLEQTHKQIEALKVKKETLIKTYDFIKDRVSATNELVKKGFAQKAQLMELETKESSAQTEIANTDIEIARFNQEVSRVEIEIMNQQNDFYTKTLSQLNQIQGQLSEATAKYLQSKDAFERAVIVSPVDGTVNVLKYHTIGSHVPGGYTIAEVSPDKDVLVVEGKLPSRNIDSVYIGLKAKMRFSAFKARTTPTFTGTLVAISPDVVQEERMGHAQEPYYEVRIEIDMDEFNKVAKNKKLQLHPGMGAEVQLVTGTRTLLQYLLDPITDTMFKAMKEK